MRNVFRRIPLAAMAAGRGLVGCTQDDPTPARSAPSDNAVAKAQDAASTEDDPCALLSDAEGTQCLAVAQRGSAISYPQNQNGLLIRADSQPGLGTNYADACPTGFFKNFGSAQILTLPAFFLEFAREARTGNSRSKLPRSKGTSFDANQIPPSLA